MAADGSAATEGRARAVSQGGRQRTSSWASRRSIEASSAPVVMEGWLHKHSVSSTHFKNWRLRYLVLRNDCSISWHSEKDGPPRGQLVLVPGVSQVNEVFESKSMDSDREIDPTQRVMRRIQITSQGVELLVEAGTPEEADEWFFALGQLLRSEKSVRFRSASSLERVVFFDDDTRDEGDAEDTTCGQVPSTSQPQILEMSAVSDEAPPALPGRAQRPAGALPPPPSAPSVTLSAGALRPSPPAVSVMRPVGALPPSPPAASIQPTAVGAAQRPSGALPSRAGSAESTAVGIQAAASLADKPGDVSLQQLVVALIAQLGIPAHDAAMALCAANGSKELAIRNLEGVGGPLRRRFRLECSNEQASGVFCLDGTFNGAARYRAATRDAVWILRLENGEWALAGHPTGREGAVMPLGQAKAGRDVSGVVEIPADGWSPFRDASGFGPIHFAWVSDAAGTDEVGGEPRRALDGWV